MPTYLVSATDSLATHVNIAAVNADLGIVSGDTVSFNRSEVFNDATLNLDPTLNADVQYYPIFNATLNAEKVAFNNDVFECREPEIFVYRRATVDVPEPADLINNDGSLVACEAKIFYKVLGGKSDTMVMAN